MIEWVRYIVNYYVKSEPPLPNLLEIIKKHKKHVFVHPGGEEIIVSTTWNDHVVFMQEVSLQHPNTLFTVKAFGEKTGDIYVRHFMNGEEEMYHADITFPPSTFIPKQGIHGIHH